MFRGFNSLKLQNFENTFFHLLQRYDENVVNIEWNGNKGRMIFFKIAREWTSGTEYKYIPYIKMLGYHFRHIYHILKFIDRADEHVIVNKNFYVNIFRANFSFDELKVLFANALEPSNYKSKLLIEKYGFFEQLDLAQLPNIDYIKKYERSAYGDNMEILAQYDVTT